MRLAQISGVPTPGNFSDYSTLVPDIVSKFLVYAIAGSGLVFLVQLIAAGYTFLTSAGDPGKVQSASKTLTHAAIGLVIVISVYSIIRILETILGTPIV